MSKVSDALINALKAKFETGDIPDGPDFSEFLDAVQEAAQDHEHNAEGGSGSGTGDAGQVAWDTGLSGKPETFPPEEHGDDAHSKNYIVGNEVPEHETDPNVDGTLQGPNLTQVRNHEPKAHDHDERYFRENEHINTSTGAPDSGKPIKLNASGKVDPTMVYGGGAFPGCEEEDMSDVTLVRDAGAVTTAYTTILDVEFACILISGLIEGIEGPGYLDQVKFTIDGVATEIPYGSGNSAMVNHLPMINADTSLKIEFKTNSGVGALCCWQLWMK